MKLQLDENTLNAYINEAIRLELNEAAGTAVRKLGQAAGGDMARMARKKTPLKFAQNVRRSKNATRGLRSFRKGKPVEGKIAKGPFKGTSYFVKQENGVTKFYSDAACTQQITNQGMLNSAKSSWNSIVSHAKNVRNSARRNALGTAAVVGAGAAGYALGNNNANAQNVDAPWNEPSDEPVDTNVPEQEPEQNNLSFPWDNTTPRWTQRKPKPAQPQQPAPAAPARPQVDAIPTQTSATQQLNQPGLTGPQAPQQGLMPRQNAATVADRSKQLMGAHASAYANGQETYGQARRGINKAARSANNTPGFEKPGINQVRANTKDALKGIKQQGQ